MTVEMPASQGPVVPGAPDMPEDPEMPGIMDVLQEGGVGNFAGMMLPGLISGNDPSIEAARRSADQPGGPGALFSALKYAPQATSQGVKYLAEYTAAADVRDIFSAIQGVDIETGMKLQTAERILYGTPILALSAGIGIGALGYAAYKGAKATDFRMRDLYAAQEGQLNLSFWDAADASKTKVVLSNKPTARLDRSAYNVLNVGDEVLDQKKLSGTQQMDELTQGSVRGAEYGKPPDAENVPFDQSKTIDLEDIDAAQQFDPGTPEQLARIGDQPDPLDVHVPAYYASSDIFDHVARAVDIEDIAHQARAPRQTIENLGKLDEAKALNVEAGLNDLGSRLVGDPRSFWSRLGGIDDDAAVTAAARFQAQRLASFRESNLFLGYEGQQFAKMWDDFVEGKIEANSPEYLAAVDNMHQMANLLDSNGMMSVEGNLGAHLHHAGIHINEEGTMHILTSHHKGEAPALKPEKSKGGNRHWLVDGMGNAIPVKDINNLPKKKGYVYLISEGMYPKPSQMDSFEGDFTINLMKTLMMAAADSNGMDMMKEFHMLGYEFYQQLSRMLYDMVGIDFNKALDILAAETPQAHMEKSSIPAMVESAVGTSNVYNDFDLATDKVVTKQDRTTLGKDIGDVVGGDNVSALAKKMEAENQKLGLPAPSGTDLMARVLDEVRDTIGSQGRQTVGPNAARIRMKKNGEPLQYLQSNAERLDVQALERDTLGVRDSGQYRAQQEAAVSNLNRPGDTAAVNPTGEAGIPYSQDIHGVFGKGESAVSYKIDRNGYMQIVGQTSLMGEKLRTMTLLPRSIDPETFVSVLNTIVADTHYYANVMGYRAGKVPHFEKAQSYAAVVRAAVNVAHMNPDLFTHLGRVQSGAWYPWRNMGGITGSPNGIIIWKEILRKVQGFSDSHVVDANMSSIDNARIKDPTEILSDPSYGKARQHDESVMFIRDEEGYVTVVAPIDFAGDLPGLYPTMNIKLGPGGMLRVWARSTPKPVTSVIDEAHDVLRLSTRVSGSASRVTGVQVYTTPNSMAYFDMPGKLRIRTAIPHDPSNLAGNEWKMQLFTDIVAQNGIEGTWHLGQEHTGYGTAYLDYTPREYFNTQAFKDEYGNMDPLSAEYSEVKDRLIQLVGWMFAGSERFRLHHTSMFAPGVPGYRADKTYNAYSVVDFGTDSSARFIPDETKPYVQHPGVLKLYHGTDVDYDKMDMRSSSSGLYYAGMYFSTEKSIPEGFGGTVHDYDIDVGTCLNIDEPGGLTEYQRIIGDLAMDGPASKQARARLQARGMLMSRGVEARNRLLEAGYDSIRANRTVIDGDGNRKLGQGVEVILLADEIPASGNIREASVQSPIEVLGQRIGSNTPSHVEWVDTTGQIPDSATSLDLLRRAYAELDASSIDPSVETWGDVGHDWQANLKQIRQSAETKKNLWFFPSTAEDMIQFYALTQRNLRDEWSKVNPEKAMTVMPTGGRNGSAPRRPWVPEFRQWDSRKIVAANQESGRGVYRVNDLFGESVLDQVYYPSSRFAELHMNVMGDGNGVNGRLHQAYEYRFQDRRTGEGGVHMVETVDPTNPHVQPVLVHEDLYPYIKDSSTDAVGKPRLTEATGTNGEKMFGRGLVVTKDAQEALVKSYDAEVEVPTLVPKGSDDASIFDVEILLTHRETGTEKYEQIKYAAIYLPPDRGALPVAPQAGVPQIMYDHREVVSYFDAAYGRENLYRLKINRGKSGQITSVTVEGTTVNGGNLIQELVKQGGVDAKVKVRYVQVDEVSLK